MTTAINAPKTPITVDSNAIAAATLPNVCKMPGPPAPFVPTPLPNIGKSNNSPQGFSTSVKIDGSAVAIQGATFNSMGDVASQGTGGGIVSSNVQGPTSFIGPGSMDTKIEGKAVQLLGDQMLNNGGPSGSPANAATMAGVVRSPGQPATMAVIEEILCELLCECLQEQSEGKFVIQMGLEADMLPMFDEGVDPGPAPLKKAAYQACVEQKFNEQYASSMPNVRAEQSFDAGGNPLGPEARGMRGTKRPDFTVLLDPAGPCQAPNIEIIEMKFLKGGDSFEKDQKDAYREIAGGKSPTELNEKTCGCAG